MLYVSQLAYGLVIMHLFVIGATLNDRQNDRLIIFIDNSSGRSAIYRLPTRKLLAVDRIFIYGFVSLISVVTRNGNPLHFKSIFPVGKPILPTYLLPHQNSCFALGSRLHHQWSLFSGYRPLMRPTPLPRKISYIYHTMLTSGSGLVQWQYNTLVSICNAYIIVTFRVRVEAWRFGVAVTRWSWSTQLFYIEPS